jgi:hypothetical protein
MHCAVCTIFAASTMTPGNVLDLPVSAIPGEPRRDNLARIQSTEVDGNSAQGPPA